jgi:hypothetical protein
VELVVTVRVEVIDESALRSAAASHLGATSPMAESVLPELASCAGVLVRAARLLQDLPGAQIRGSGTSTGYWDPAVP